jgi:drug/metabolite transporter (DMT)-like permease
LDSSGAILKAMAIGYAGKRPMHKRNAVQLRLAFSAAAVGAVLAAATFSGAHRTGSFVSQTVRETEPILVGSISTIKKPGGAKAGTRR